MDNTNRDIILCGDISDNVAKETCEKLLKYNNEKIDDINLYISSLAGSVSAGLTIINVMQSIRSTVRTICIGTTAGVGAIILAMGEKGYRTCVPNAKLSLSFRTMYYTIKNYTNEPDLVNEYTRETRTRVYNLLSSVTNSTTEEAKTLCHEDWLSAEDAKNKGLIDYSNGTHIPFITNMDREIESLHLSSRTRMILLRNGINTVNKFMDMPMNDFAKIPNVGKKTIKEVTTTRELIQNGEFKFSN